MAASQVRLGHLLEKRSVASRVVAGDKVWLDSKDTPIDKSYTLSARWFGPFEVLSADGVAVTLDLLETFGKAHHKVNIQHLEFYEQSDSWFGEADGRQEPLITSGCVACYEVRRISNARIHEGQSELWVDWKGYDQSQNCWVHRDILMGDFPESVKAFDAAFDVQSAHVGVKTHHQGIQDARYDIDTRSQDGPAQRCH